MTNLPTLQMEVKKDGLSQLQSGAWKMTLTVHPNDMHEAIMKAPMGTRYVAVLVEVGDDEQPKPVMDFETAVNTIYPKPEKPKREMTRSQVAALKCRAPEFQGWVRQKWPHLWASERAPFGGEPESRTAQIVRATCGVISRASLDTDPAAGRRWDSLLAEYDAHTGRLAERRQ